VPEGTANARFPTASFASARPEDVVGKRRRKEKEMMPPVHGEGRKDRRVGCWGSIENAVARRSLLRRRRGIVSFQG
jgi:hypothetical protein